MQPPSIPLPVRYPHISRVARMLGTSRQNLWRALRGDIFSPRLARAYVELALPRLVSALAPTQLPAGTRLEIPTASDREAVAAALGAHVSADGPALVLLAALPLMPPAPPLVSPPVSATKSTRRARQARPTQQQP